MQTAQRRRKWTTKGATGKQIPIIKWTGRSIGRLARLGAFCILSIFASLTAFAAEIGQSRGEIIAKHGMPFSSNDGRDAAVYRWDSWSLEVAYVQDVADKLTYRKETPISINEIAGILTANGGKDAWTKFNERLWVRKDGVSGNFDGTDPKMFWIQGKQLLAQPAPEPSSIYEEVEATSKVVISEVPQKVKRIPLVPTASILALLILLLVIWLCVSRRRKALSEVKPEPPVSFLPYDESVDLEKIAAATPVEADLAEETPLTFDSITWDQFELAVAEIYRRQGYQAEISSGLGADGGVDVKLTRGGETTLVQCKQWKSGKVGVKEIREFYGVLVSEGAERGIFITTAEYSRDATEFAAGKPIDLISRQEVHLLVSTVQNPGENFWDIHQWLDDLIAYSRIVNPACPRCQDSMILRHPAHGTPFWGCRTYPSCMGKRDARLEIVQSEVYSTNRT